MFIWNLKKKLIATYILTISWKYGLDYCFGEISSNKLSRSVKVSY